MFAVIALSIQMIMRQPIRMKPVLQSQEAIKFVNQR